MYQPRARRRHNLGACLPDPFFPPPHSYLRNGTCCDNSTFFSRGRDADVGDWCALRRAAGGCSLVTAGALLAAAVVCHFTRARRLTMLPTAVLGLLACELIVSIRRVFYSAKQRRFGVQCLPRLPSLTITRFPCSCDGPHHHHHLWSVVFPRKRPRPRLQLSPLHLGGIWRH